MSDSCATCFFYVSAAGTCNIGPPKVTDGTNYAWPKVQSTDWCGAGCDASTKAGFSTGILTPGTGSPVPFG